MDENKEKLPFKKWFTDVFWYHYKWWFIAGVFAITLIVCITVEALGNEKYDFTVVFGISGTVSEEYMEEFESVVGEAVGDLDGSGDVNIRVVSVDVSNSENGRDVSALGVSENTEENNQSRMLLYLIDEEYTLYILDDDSAALYCASDYFEDKLADYGIRSEADNPYIVKVSDTPIFQRMGLDGKNLYAAIIDWTTVGKGSQERTDATVRALEAILNTK